MRKLMLFVLTLSFTSIVNAQDLTTVVGNLKNFFIDYVDEQGNVVFDYQVSVRDDSSYINAFLGYKGNNILANIALKYDESNTNLLLFYVNKKLNGVLVYSGNSIDLNEYYGENPVNATLVFIDYDNHKILGVQQLEGITINGLAYNLYEYLKNGEISDNPVAIASLQGVFNEEFYTEVEKLSNFLYQAYDVID